MLPIALLSPTQRHALRVADAARGHALLRCRGGFTAPGTTAVITMRTANRLELDRLLDFDPPQYPDRAVLTADGRALARQLRPAAGAP